MGTLHIKQLSKSGEPIGLISCSAAEITVFRATSEKELLPYVRALHNTPGPEKFKLERDDKIYLPEETIIIDGGEHFTDSITLEAWLAEREDNSSLYKNAAKELELDKRFDTTISSLSPCEQQRARILALSLEREKLVVLNSPFSPIAHALKERVATFLLNVTYSQQHICVVTTLHYRPQSWVDNEHIKRVEVGQNLQKTIGFGQTPSELQAMLEAVRKEAKNTPRETPPSMLDEAGGAEKDKSAPQPISAQQRKKGKLIPLSLGMLLIGGIVYFFTDSSTTPPLKPVAPIAQPVVVKKVNEPEVKQTPKKVYALLQYPKDIQNSVVATFQGTSEGVDYERQQRKKELAPKNNSKKKKKTVSAGESLLEALQRTNNTGDKITTTPERRPNVGSRSPGSPGSSKAADYMRISEERREQLREKFRQALERASKNKR